MVKKKIQIKKQKFQKFLQQIMKQSINIAVKMKKTELKCP